MTDVQPATGTSSVTLRPHDPPHQPEGGKAEGHAEECDEPQGSRPRREHHAPKVGHELSERVPGGSAVLVAHRDRDVRPCG